MDWKMVPVSEVATAVLGGTPARKVAQYWARNRKGVKWATAKDIASAHGRFLYDSEERITQNGLDNSAAKLLPGNTVVITARGTVGKIVQLGTAMAFNQSCYGLLTSDSILPDFLYYALNGTLASMQSLTYGTVFDTITIKTFKRWYIPLPSLAEQKAVAHVLGALDDKIELNRRMSRTLEKMAKALFKSWFVDFDPVHAKAEVRKEHPDWTDEQVSRVACPDLALEISTLFPDTFQNSQLGEIPKGWVIDGMSDIFDVNPKRVLPKNKLAPYLPMASMPTKGAFPKFWTMREAGSGVRFINGDTLVARITPCLENGKIAYVDFLDDGQVGWGSTEYISLRPKGTVPTQIAYLFSRSESFLKFAIQQMTGSSGRQRVPVSSLKQYTVVHPGIESRIYSIFGKQIHPIFNQIKGLAGQSITLTSLRDTLLPKLIAGELRVPDVENLVSRQV